MLWRGTGHARRPSDAKQVLRIRTNLSMVFQQFNSGRIVDPANVMEARSPCWGRDRAEVEASARAYLDKVGIWR